LALRVPDDDIPENA